MTVSAPGSSPSSSAPTRIGILDWGIGGLDVLGKLRAAGEQASVLYCSDSGSIPYGRQSEHDLQRRIARLVRMMAERGCGTVVVGCNAASTVLRSPRVQEAAASVHRLCGVIEPAVAVTRSLDVPEVVVIGGRRTIESRAYHDPLEAAGIRVRGRIAQPLSALVEAGVLGGPRLARCLDDILTPVADGTTLVSACTHYLAVETEIRRRLPGLRNLVDPARIVAQQLATTTTTTTAPAPPDRFVTTGDAAATERAAAAAFGLSVRFEHDPTLGDR